MMTGKEQKEYSPVDQKGQSVSHTFKFHTRYFRTLANNAELRLLDCVLTDHLLLPVSHYYWICQKL